MRKKRFEQEVYSMGFKDKEWHACFKRDVYYCIAGEKGNRRDGIKDNKELCNKKVRYK